MVLSLVSGFVRGLIVDSKCKGATHRGRGPKNGAKGRDRFRLERLEDRTVMTAGIGVNFTGNTFGNSGGVTPPDTQGDVGPNHIINFTNGSFAIFNKLTGALISRTSDATFWSTKVGVSFTGGLSDPRLVYDMTSGRWFACEITTVSTANKVLIGRSDTSDPTGTWKGTSFTGSVGFADYPTLGVDADAVYIGINNFTGASGVSLFSIPKTSLTAATPTTTGMASFQQLAANTYGFTLQGATTSDASLGHGSIIATDNDTFGLTRFNVNGSAAAGATLGAVTTIPIATYSANVQARQPDGTAQVSTLDDRFSGSAYRVGNFIYVAHCVALSSRANVKVYVVNETTNALVATATIGDGVHDFFQPTIAANSLGNVVVGYNRSGTAAGEFISSYASIGTFNGTTLTLESPMLVTAGLALYHLQSGSGQRWGDYSATRPDVSNPSTFWSFQEFVPSANNYATAVSQLNVVNTTLTLDGSNNLVITDTAPNGKNDQLTIQSDAANSRFVVTDPVNFIGTSIAGASGDKTHTVFIPFASVTGGSIIVNTLAGTDSVAVDNSLGLFAKTLAVDGGSGADSLTVNGTALADSMTVNATTVAFGAFSLGYSNTETASIDGLAGGDTFALAPNATTTFTVVGSVPAFPTLVNADFLNLNLSGVTGQSLSATGNGAGTWSFSNRNPVTFSGMERMSPGVTISGRVFQDLDNNGNDNGGADPGMLAVTVNLDSLADGTTDLTTSSLAGGSYSFTDLAPGNYRVRQVVPGGFTQSSADPADLTFSSLLANTGLNFGNFGGGDTIPPTITSIGSVAPNPRNTPVSTIVVTFSEPINLATFTVADLTLTRNGGNVNFSGNESFVLLSGTTYEVGGLTEETGADGTYVISIAPSGIQDLAGNNGVGAPASTSWTTDATAPIVTGLFFDGSSWSAGFRTAAGNATFGYPAQTGASQLTTLPWSTINTVYIQFSENVSITTANLGVRGVNVASYAPTLANYDNVNFVAKFTFAGNLDTDWVILDLDGASGSAVADALGNKLAGAWVENVSTLPTSGAAGNSFKYRFVVGVGDADRNGQIRNADVNVVRNNLFIDAGMGGYNIFADINGDGLVRNADSNIVRNRLFIDPPSGPGPSRPGRGGSNGGRGQIATGGSLFASSKSVEPNHSAASLRRLAAQRVSEELDQLFTEL